MNIGKWIVLAFVFFTLFITTLVVVCIRQDIPLVTKDYYAEELKFQDQIDRSNNTEALTEKPVITLKDDALVVDYNQLPNIENGELKLFRPSDPSLDQNFPITTTLSTSQSFLLHDVRRGLYRARLSWEQEGKEYYLEKIIVL